MFRRSALPRQEELKALVEWLAARVDSSLERRGLPFRDTENELVEFNPEADRAVRGSRCLRRERGAQSPPVAALGLWAAGNLVLHEVATGSASASGGGVQGHDCTAP